VDIGSITKVYIDNYHGGKIAAEHLIKKGCRHFLACTQYTTRTDGFIDTVKAVGHKRIGTFTPDNAAAYFENFLKISNITEQFPLGVFCTSDLSALRVMKAVRKTPFRIGTDILLIGYDNQYLTEEYDPPLTTVHQPFQEEGILAVKMLIKMIYNGRQKIKSEKMLPELIVRESA
jgi:DNA-binding LacI/PurR family transcriptional regulator